MAKPTNRDVLIAKMRHAAENLPFSVAGDEDFDRETRKMRAALEVAEAHIWSEMNEFINSRKLEDQAND